jgi:ElaB/YqjD/DUF883 family membrane-anchored ribosome-binding protein
MTQATDEAGRQHGVTDQASEKVQEAASVAQEKASELREQGSARLRDQFDQRSTRAGTQVRSLAESLRRSGNDFDHEGNAGAARLTGQAADRVERLGRYLEEKSGDEFMRDIESFVRRRPWMVATAGMFAGLASARFVKASSERRHVNHRPAGGQRPSAPGDGTSGYAGTPDDRRLGSGTSGVADSDPGAASTDDALARDPYAGTR